MLCLFSSCLRWWVLSFSTNSITGGGSRFSRGEAPSESHPTDRESSAIPKKTDKDIKFLEERIKELGSQINQMQTTKDLMQKALDRMKGRINHEA